MFRFHILGRIFLALLLVALMIGGGLALYRLGWAQGYSLGALSTAGSNTPSQGGQALPGFNPYLAYPYFARPFFGFGPFFNPFGLFFGIGIFFLILFLVGGLFRGFGWRRWAGNPGGYGSHGWGPDPRWEKEWREWKEYQAQKKADSGDAPQGEEQK